MGTREDRIDAAVRLESLNEAAAIISRSGRDRIALIVTACEAYGTEFVFENIGEVLLEAGISSDEINILLERRDETKL